MSMGVRMSRGAVDRTVGGLPARWRWLPQGRDYLVIGPTGAFAVAEGLPTTDQAAERVARTAGEIRDFLVTVGSWAPFVDPLVVVDGPVVTVARATFVPSHLLGGVLTRGPQLLTDVEVVRIAERMESRQLVGSR
jgi:hypothetical protein